MRDYIARLETAALDRRQAERGIAVLARLEEDLEFEALARLLGTRSRIAEAAARRGQALINRAAFLDALLRSIAEEPSLTLAKSDLAEEGLRRHGVRRGLSARDAAKNAPGREQLSALIAAVDPRPLLDELRARLSGKTDEQRSALRVLQRADRPVLLAELHALLKSKAPLELHIEVARCLAHFRQARSVAPLMAKLDRGPTSLRGAIERALTAIVGAAPDGDWESWWEAKADSWTALPELAEELLDESQPIKERLAILGELDQKRGPAMARAVIQLTKHGDGSLRIAAIQAIGAMQLHRAARALLPALDSPIAAEARAARRALQQLSGQDLGPTRAAWQALYPPKKEAP